jgi:hypothetical protein
MMPNGPDPFGADTNHTEVAIVTLVASSGRPVVPPAKADEWFQNPIQAIAVTSTGPFSATADGACPVEFDRGTAGFVKPRPGAAKNLVVAREKIAFDLAYLLGLPVAPVVVRLPDPPDWPHYSALSLVVSPTARLWGAGGYNIATAAECLEALRVFWTWIGDNDHNGHPGNLLFLMHSGQCEVTAIDHSYSLCHGNQATPLQVGVCQGYGTANLPGASVWRAAVIDKIKSVEWSMVEQTVRRLEPILGKGEQDKIIGILSARRDHLTTSFGL